MKIKDLLSVGVAVFALNLAAMAQTEMAIVGAPTGTIRNDSYGWGAGFGFYVPSGGSTTVNALGFWDESGTGLQENHIVALYQYAGSGSAYNLMTSVTIPAGTVAPLIDGYRWVSIPALNLPDNGQNGNYYIIIASEGDDDWTTMSGQTLNPAIGTFSSGALIDDSSGENLSPTPPKYFASVDGNNSGYGGGNVGFIYELASLPVLLTNTAPASAEAGIGGQAAFTVAFSDSLPIKLQWEEIANGTTNPVNAVNATIDTVTNNGEVSSTLTFSNLQVANSGSYQLEAVNATNNQDVTCSAPAPLTVYSLISWLQTGTFTSDAVLALAGTPANEVYGVDFGAGSQRTANGYTFTDAYSGPVPTTSPETGTVRTNMSMTGSISQQAGYLPSTNTTGDGALDNILNNGIWGDGGLSPSPMNGTLLNLTVGQEYTVLVLLDDTRTGLIGDPTQVPKTAFYGTDGVSVSPYQPFVFPDATNEAGVTEIGGYALGIFTAKSTNEPLSVVCQYLDGQFLDSQYNAVLVEKTTQAPPALPIYLNANTQPTPATVAEGSNVIFFAACVNYYEPLKLQWQLINTNGVTNNISAGVMTMTNLGIVSSTLTLSNLQLDSTGSSCQLEAIDATDSSDVAYSTPIPLTVVPPITSSSTNNYSTLINFNTNGLQITRFDTVAAAIDAHDGVIAYFKGVFYLYGTSYDCGFEWEQSGSPFCGFKVYSSTDLVNWTDRGFLFNAQTPVWQSRCNGSTTGCFRPHVVYNQANNLYVLWINTADNVVGYRVFTSTSPVGPFTEIAQPTLADSTNGPVSNGDHDLFVDDDGTAYIAYTDWSSGGAIMVEKLNADYTSGTGEHVQVTPASTESPGMMKRNGVYYLLYSDPNCGYCSGTGTSYRTASSPLGPWSSGTSISANSCGGQPSFVSTIKMGSQVIFLYGSDLWNNGAKNEALANFYWAPLTFAANGSINPLECQGEVSVAIMPDRDPQLSICDLDSTSGGDGFTSFCDISGNTERSQSFVATRTGTLSAVSFCTFQSGIPNAGLTIQIYQANSAYQPVGRPLNSTLVLPDSIGWAPQLITVNPGIAVTAGVRYAIVVSSASSKGCYGFEYNDSAPYPGGGEAYSDNGGASFSAEQNRSFMFRTYISNPSGQLELDWSPFYLGWILQEQTNSLTTGLGTNWFMIPGSGETNRVFIQMNPTNGSAWFRLVFSN